MDQNDTTLSARLSERQRQCLSLVAEGCSSKQIARQLGLSPSTVDNHINVAVRLLRVENRQKAAQLMAEVSESKSGSHTIDPQPTGRAKILRFIPIGGQPNMLPLRMRIWLIFQIALVSVMGMSAIVVVISGFVSLFTR